MRRTTSTWMWRTSWKFRRWMIWSGKFYSMNVTKKLKRPALSTNANVSNFSKTVNNSSSNRRIANGWLSSLTWANVVAMTAAAKKVPTRITDANVWGRVRQKQSSEPSWLTLIATIAPKAKKPKDCLKRRYRLSQLTRSQYSWPTSLK